MFDNGYSIVSLVNVIHIGRFGTVLSGVFIYKDGALIKEIRQRYPLKRFYGSEETVLLTIDNKELVKGTIGSDDSWNYTINRGNQHDGFKLQLKKTMKPFKGKTYLGNWLVIPRFDVSGNLFLNGERISVLGHGYHDHNIYPIKAPFVTKGYFFGKISLSDSYIIWAYIKKDKKHIEHLVMLAKKDEYVSIHPDNIKFSIIEEKKDHRKIMPTHCRLIVDDENLKLNIDFTPEDHHHIGILAAHYWRYHVRYTGEIQTKQEVAKIDTLGIAEYLRFF